MYTSNWQILDFVPYKGFGEVLLDAGHAHFLCEEMEDVGLRLATMLVSRHMIPLWEEAGQWAARLARVHNILTQVRTCTVYIYTCI